MEQTTTNTKVKRDLSYDDKVIKKIADENSAAGGDSGYTPSRYQQRDSARVQ